MEKIKIAVVDDLNLFRQSLALLIGFVENLELVFEAESGTDFLEKLSSQDAIKPDIAIIDMNMPGMNGIELNDIIHKKHQGIRVIVLSVHSQPELIAQMINAGASGYLAKNCDKDELVLAIETVYKTGFYFNTDTLAAIKQHNSHKIQAQKSLSNIPIKLTSRETEVLQLICKEMSNAEIGEKLFLSTRTVEGHRNSLLIKTGCRNTAGLVLFAIRYAIFQLSL
jgi:DNA-binding NarL/FixJ family response regulator